MRRYLPLTVVAAVALSACQDDSSPATPDLVPPTAEASSASPRSVDVIVTLNPDFAPGGHEANQRAAAAVARSLGVSAAHTYGTALYGFSATVPEGRLNGLRNDPRVAAIELDQMASVIPFPVASRRPSGGGGGGGGSTQTTPWGITRVNGGSGTASGTAWVIDSGVDLNHPDLNVDVGRSVDFTGSRKGADDENGHGTHVAGTIAAVNNNQGVIGVAPGATVVAVRVLNRQGSGSYSGVIAGIDHVGAHGRAGDVANMSLGGPFSAAVNQAVVNASSVVKFSLAAGNESTDAATKSPASANGPNIYTVSASDSSDRLASFSNYGNPPVDFAAPGVSIYSTYKDGGYATLSGTSMAAPHVAGVLLLGAIRSDGTVSGDKGSGYPDPIAVH